MNQFNYLKERLSIIDVIGHYTTINKQGRLWNGRCPQQDLNNRKSLLSSSPDKQVFYCYGCKTGGDAISFVAKMERCSQQEALQILCQRYQITIPPELFDQGIELDQEHNKKLQHEYTEREQKKAKNAHKEGMPERMRADSRSEDKSHMPRGGWKWGKGCGLPASGIPASGVAANMNYSKLPASGMEANGLPAREDEGLHFKIRYSGLQVLPTGSKEIEELADELMAYAAQEDVFKLEDFPLMKQYSPHKFFKLAEVNEKFARALDYARHAVGSRLQHKLVYEGMNPTFAMKMLPLYHRDYREWELERRTQKEQPKTQTVVAVIPEWTPSPEVLKKAGDTNDQGDTSR